MPSASYSIGVVFDLDVLEQGYYAFLLFMKQANPKRLAYCTLYSGDIDRPPLEVVKCTYDYCVAVSGSAEAVQFVRDLFSASDLLGLAPKHRRLIEGLTPSRLGLPEDGFIDLSGRLVAAEWNPDQHRQCMEAGWGYNPRNVNAAYGLSPDQEAELTELRKPR